MKKVISKAILILILWAVSFPSFGQNNNTKGSLFIIGGGKQPGYMVKAMVATADLQPDDYILILPMASSDGPEAIKNMKIRFKEYTNNKITGFDFTKSNTSKKAWVDSVAQARFIYFTGGSQRRLMSIVHDTPLYSAIHQAFNNGSTIGGTSAGAAMMSKVMITGQHTDDLSDYSTFESIKYDNVRTIEGMGLLPAYTIIDQHFIKRSRFNRLISAIADHPIYVGVGIDESTAIICNGGKATVIGEGQVLVLSNPQGLSMASDRLVTLKNIRLSLLSSGDTFKLR